MESKQAGAKPNSSGERLARLRELLRAQKLDAFVVPTNDAHMSEYIAECDKRRQFISGFTGSAGTAVIPLEGKARLWTDGRYFLQATTELDDNWVLMKDRLPETPSVPEWLSKELAAGSRVGIDAKVMSVAEARTYLNTFKQHDIELVSVEENPVDIVWGEAKPPAPLGKVMVHPLSYAGQSYQDKIAQLRDAMANAKVAAVVVSALDEVAWLLNIRGSDIPFNPVVQAYILVTKEDISLYIDKHKLDEEAEQHLSDVKLLPYNQIFDDLKQLNAENKRVWIDSQKCSKALADCLSTTNTYENFSPLSLPKAIKNETELEGLRQCHLRDAAALINFFSWLETAIESGTETEVSVSDKLEGFRKEQKDFISLSFDTIAGSGPNGAIIHYKPAPESCAIVRKDQMFLCDSGGQYRDGTTDVTRTMHFGSPSQYEKHCFTRVLQGHIGLSMAIFPNGTTGHQMDVLARLPLWKDGLDYRHGTGHGVGAFLNVHEGPQGIGLRETPTRTALVPGMTVTNEPGYYEDGAFGIRIENVMIVNKANTPHRFGDKDYYGLEPITFVPIQAKLIDTTLLSAEEKQWLNNYHQQCWALVSPLLVPESAAMDWLYRHTRPLTE